MTAAKDYPTITKAYYVRTGERGDIVLKVEFEDLPPMTFYAESIKGLVLKEGILVRVFGNAEYPYEYKYGEDVEGSQLGIQGPATKHPGLIRLLRRFYDDRMRGVYEPGTDITEELGKTDIHPHWTTERSQSN